MLGRTPKLDLGALQRKMILGGRGGYCLEQNMLFREGLRSLGYQITSLQGRVVRGMAIDAQRPAIHMLLQVELPEGAYLADVGFGNLAPTSALLLRPGIEQETPHEPMRFIDVGGELTLQAKLRDTWEHIYRVIPYPRYDGEYEITNWYTGTHPDAPYQSNIIAARPGPNRTRITMFNARVTVRHATGEAERRRLSDEGEFRSVLLQHFKAVTRSASTSDQIGSSATMVISPVTYDLVALRYVGVAASRSASWGLISRTLDIVLAWIDTAKRFGSISGEAK